MRHASAVLGIGLLVASSLAACGGDNGDDAGLDATVDTGPRDARIDAPPAICAPVCAVGTTCCDLPGGPNECLQLRIDPLHCGRCEIDCVTTNRGDSCELGSCVCGADALGCSGTSESYCCPPLTPGRQRYCANFETEATNCGGCGITCDFNRSDRCAGQECVCGIRDACDGTPTSRCCTTGVDVACADTTTDRFHCGDCNVLCQGVERCENSACTRGAACTATCSTSDICCDGTCCDRLDCLNGRCGTLVDGGPMDGGSDAGTDGGFDAGLDGGIDAGVGGG